MNPLQQKELNDLDRILKIVRKWDTEEIIDTEKGSLWANINSACLLIQEEIKAVA